MENEKQIGRENAGNALKLEQFIEGSPQLQKAYNWALRAHEGQFRADGTTPYITHCLAVARIIYEEWGIKDVNIISAALLHDTVEDSKLITIPLIRSEFGAEVSSWVEGVTQLRSEKGNADKEQTDRETLRKVNRASFIEPQVGVIKLADRLHNMRTLEFMSPDKQVSKARETLFYAKLAESLGMWEVMRELEDLSIKYINPDEYKKYLQLRDEDPRTQPEFVEGLKSNLRAILEEAGVEARVEVRKNSLLKIKDKRGKYLPERIDDLIRFGIIVKEGDSELETRNRVMMALGALWQEFDAIEDKARFDNFFFTPRDNGYSALHLTLKFRGGDVKVALTCEEKELYNNHGILSLINNKADLHKYALKLVFTPTKEVKFFRARATGIDYAYSISPNMGAKAEYVLFDGVRHQLTEIIPNGVTVDIRQDKPRRAPNKAFRNFALPPARKIIDQQIDEQTKFEKTMEGKVIVEKIIRSRGLLDLEDLKEIEELKPNFDDILLLLGCKEDVMDLYHNIGSGVMDPNSFTEMLNKEGITKNRIGTTVYIEGHDQLGMSKTIIDKITGLGGNIGFQKSNISKTNSTFSFKLIVENLTGENEEELARFYQNDPRITKVVVV